MNKNLKYIFGHPVRQYRLMLMFTNIGSVSKAKHNVTCKKISKSWFMYDKFCILIYSDCNDFLKVRFH